MALLQLHPSISAEQKEAEEAALTYLSKKWEIELNPAIIELGIAKVQIDGYNPSEKIFVEVYAGVGKLKPAQIKKVLADAFKLAAIERSGIYGQSCQKYLCFIDQYALDCFGKKSWHYYAFEAFGIELVLAELSPELMQSVRDAKNRQGVAFRSLATASTESNAAPRNS